MTALIGADAEVRALPEIGWLVMVPLFPPVGPGRLAGETPEKHTQRPAE